MTISQSNYWQKIVKTAKSIYEAEKELLTHCLTLAALLLMIGAAVFADARLQPKTAEAVTVNTAAEAADVKKLPPAATTPPAEPAQPPAQTGPGLPPPLAQGVENLNPALVQRFDAFRTYVFQTYGTVLEIRSGYRSPAEQARLFATLPPGRANPPGKSLHEKGEAIDYTNYSPQLNQHLGTFGLRLPYPGKEDWHIERIDGPPQP